MNIFEVTDAAATDWVKASSAEEAIECAEKEGCLCESEEPLEARPLSDDEASEIIIDVAGVRMSLLEAFRFDHEERPLVLASSEW